MGRTGGGGRQELDRGLCRCGSGGGILAGDQAVGGGGVGLKIGRLLENSAALAEGGLQQKRDSGGEF